MDDKTERVLEMLRQERAKQVEKWGQQDHDPGTWLLILTEEVGEAAQAILQDRQIDAWKELVQAGAVIVAWLEDALFQEYVS